MTSTVRIPALVLTLDGDAYTTTYRDRALRGSPLDIVAAALEIDAPAQAIADAWRAKLEAMPEVRVTARYGSETSARIMRTTPTQIILAGYAPDTEGGRFKRSRWGSYHEVGGHNHRSIVSASLPPELRGDS